MQPPNVEPIDRSIADWKNKLAAASDNLLALYDHPSYKRLQGGDAGTPLQLTGVSAALVTPALNAMNELFAQMGLLNDVVDRAQKLRAGYNGFPWSEKVLQQIQDLLNGPSIQLPPVKTPLEQRGLLTASEQARAITPDRLLGIMTQAFDAAKQAVFAVDQAWTRLDTVFASAETKLSVLEQRAGSMGADSTAEAASVRQQLNYLRSTAKTDPLGAAASGNVDSQLLTALDNLRTRLDALAKDRDAANTGIADARSALAALRDLKAKADAALARTRQQIDNPHGLLASITDAQLAELSQWLDTLEQTRNSGNWRALGMGLQRWNALAADYKAAQTTALAANQAPLEALAELRGRFSAIEVKARARGMADLPALAQVSAQTKPLLNQSPAPLDAIDKLVSQYERLLDTSNK